MAVFVAVVVRRWTVHAFTFGAERMTTGRANSLENDLVSAYVTSLVRSVKEILVGSVFLVRELTGRARDAILIKQIPGDKSSCSPGTVGRPLTCFARRRNGIQRSVSRCLF